jgi:hypothetical protein
MGYSRQQFYEIRRNFQTYGAEGLIDRLPGAKGPHPNRVSAEIEQAILDHALVHPATARRGLSRSFVSRAFKCPPEACAACGRRRTPEAWSPSTRSSTLKGVGQSHSGFFFSRTTWSPQVHCKSSQFATLKTANASPSREVRMCITMLPARASFLTRLVALGRKWRTAAGRYGESRAAVALRLVALYRQRGFRPGEALALGLVDPAISEEALGACFTKPELLALQDRLNPPQLISLTEDKGVFDAYCVARGIPVPTHFATLGRAPGQPPPAPPLQGRRPEAAGATHCRLDQPTEKGANTGLNQTRLLTNLMTPGVSKSLTRSAPTLTSRDEWLRDVVPRLPASFITKPALGVYGEGVTSWTRTDSGFRDHAQRVHSAQALYDLCCADPRYDRFVVQKRLTNHPSLVALTGASSLQTLRLATLAEAEGEAKVLYAEWKLVVGDNVTDNLSFGRSGNLATNVALADGAIGPARGFSPDGVGLRPLPIHPVTGASLEGFRLPDWNAVLALALRCARLFLPLRTIGWDIGLTPDGPVIVEGNRWWDPPNDSVLGPPAPGVARHELFSGASLLRAAALRASPP